MKECNVKFLRRYAKLEKLCRDKYDGDDNHLSAVKAFSESLPTEQQESLCNLIRLKNEMMSHVHAPAGATENDVQQLDAFIAIIKGSLR